jgi:hypothetical protein
MFALHDLGPMILARELAHTRFGGREQTQKWLIAADSRKGVATRRQSKARRGAQRRDPFSPEENLPHGSLAKIRTACYIFPISRIKTDWQAARRREEKGRISYLGST